MTDQERQNFITGLSFDGEIEDCDGVLMFTLDKNFDLAAAFEGIYDPEQDPPIERIELPYCIRDQLVWYTLTLVLEHQDDMCDSEQKVFPLSDREREYLKGKMNDYCLQQTGMPLLEYGILHWFEDDGPRQTSTGPTVSAQRERSMSQSLSGFDLMGIFAIQCVGQMAQDIQSRVTPEEWDKIVAETLQAEEQQNEQTMGMGPTMG